MRFLLVVVFCALAARVIATESFKSRFLSVSMCFTYINEMIEPAKSADSTLDSGKSDPMSEACLETFQKEPYILAMVRNLLISNITFSQLEKCKSTDLSESQVWAKLKPVWKIFTETIERDEFLNEEQICNFFTNSLNPILCSLKEEGCESKLASTIYAFYYLYAQATLNVSVLENCWTLPHSLIKMKENPLHAAIYAPEFDLNAQKIVVGDVCATHNQLWLTTKRKQPKKSDQKKPFSMGLQQFQSFSRVIHDF